MQSGLKFEIGRPAAHPGVAESIIVIIIVIINCIYTSYILYIYYIILHYIISY